MIKKILKRCFVTALLIIILITITSQILAAALPNIIYTEQELRSVSQGIVNWKKLDNDSTLDGDLINNNYLLQAGSTPGDWYQIGMSRLGIEDDYAGYMAVIKENIKERYNEIGKLSSAKATEWHRISLSILASGGDPRNVGTDEEGNSIDLIADGTYDRGKTISLGRQGINGWIWGLISLDSMHYNVPENSANTREDIVMEILAKQLRDGGFALSGANSDPDITAMALQALAPYYNNEKIYTYTKKSTNTEIATTVRKIADEAISWLAYEQTKDGDFASWGVQNVESTVQVAVALCSLGIDIQKDERFIKNGKSLMDGIMKYHMKDGGFIHSFTYDEDNPTSLPNQSNTMASEQVLYGLAAIIRQMKDMRILYDFRSEHSENIKGRIVSIREDIADITENTDKTRLSSILEAYYSLPETERSYVYNYCVLSDRAEGLGVDITAISNGTAVIIDTDRKLNDKPIVFFSKEDMQTVNSIPDVLTTEQYVLVVKLLDKLSRAAEFDDMYDVRQRLEMAKMDIEVIQKEIDAINADVLENLYPFDKITLANKNMVDFIVKRYNTLSEYDKEKIERWDDVIRCKIKLDNQIRGIIISITLSVIAIIVVIVVVKRICRRKLVKRLAMEELIAEYENDE